MQKFLIFFQTFLSLSFSLTDSNCYKIQCSTETSLYCLQSNDSNKTIFITPCSSGTCSISDQLSSLTNSWTNVYCYPVSMGTIPSISFKCNTTLTEDTLYTGQGCCNSTQCVSGTCEENMCQGVIIGTCTSDEVCMSGFYCDKTTSKCTASIEAGGSCTYDNQCPVGYGCNYGVCTGIFVLDVGEKTENKKFCVTHIEYGGYCDAIKVVINGKTLGNPYNCTIGESCEYYYVNSDQKIGSESCLCDGVHQDTGYCGSYMSMVENNTKELFYVMQYNNSACSGWFAHTDDVDTLYDCGAITDNQWEWYYNMINQTKFWVLYQSGAIDGCAESLDLFDPEYVFSEYDNWAEKIFVTLIALYLI